MTLGEHALRYTLCFLTRGDRVLMLRRRRAPNRGLWNGVGGKIETGEIPRSACLREVREEVFTAQARNGAIETHEAVPLRAFAGLADCH